MNDDDLMITLANGLAVALEMSYDTVELRELWAEEISALRLYSDKLTARGLTPPASLKNILALADG